MTSIQPADPNSALEQVRREFIHWRAIRSGRSHTPVVLRRRAASLLIEHRAFHVCRALGVNATALKRWASEDSLAASEAGESIAFVPLENEVVPSRLDKLTMPTSALIVELPGGIRVLCESAPRVAELLEALGARSAMAACP